MTDYSQGKIYLVYIPGLEEVGYIGSTVEPLNKRLSEHKCSAKSEKTKYYFASCVLFGEGNEVAIKLLEAYPCENKQQLLERERYWLEQYPDAINKNTPVLTEEERLTRNREICLRNYYDNREERLAKQKEYKQENKEYLSEYQKQKRLKNLEEARAKDRESNARRDKAKRLEWKNKKVSCCACGLVMSRNNFSTHKKNKHPDTEVSYALQE